MGTDKRQRSGPGWTAREYERFLEGLPDLVYVTDDDARIVWVNAAFEKVTGVPRADALGRPFAPLFREDCRATLADAYRRTLAGDDVESVLTFENGTTCHFSGLPRRDESGRILGVLGIARNISTRLAAEKNLAESEHRFRSLFDNVNEAVALHEIVEDESGEVVDFTFLDCNPTFERLTGQPRDAVVGRRGRDVLRMSKRTGWRVSSR